MTADQYLILGYVVAIGLLWGYATYLLFSVAALNRRELYREAPPSTDDLPSHVLEAPEGN